MIDDLEEQVRLNMIAFRKGKKLRQKQFCDALGWGYHILPDLESGKTKWSLARIGQVCRVFQVPPDFFIMGEEIYEEKTGILRVLHQLEPEKRRALHRLIRQWRITDYRVLEQVLTFARRFYNAGRRSIEQEKEEGK